jgi:TRAP-type C4-dicarboxylate transport system permease small subunit
MSTESNEAEDRFAGPRMGRLARILALIGGGILLALSMLVTTSVGLRIVTGAGIDGDFEVVQLGAAIAAFCLFPLCLSIRGNIFVDTFTMKLPHRWNAVLDGLWDALFGVIALVIAARMVVGAMDQLASKTTLMVLAVPTWWAVAICAGLLALLGITALVVGYRMLSGKASGGEA